MNLCKVVKSDNFISSFIGSFAALLVRMSIKVPIKSLSIVLFFFSSFMQMPLVSDAIYFLNFDLL
jgi:hypothetical protein